MSLDFDPSFDWLWVLVAGQAPKVDVAAVRALAQNWLESGRTLLDMANDVAQLVGSVGQAVGGQAGRAFRDQVTHVLGQVPRIALITEAQSSSLLDLALNVEHSIYAMMVEIAFFAASILWALSSPFTAPLVPAFITSARIAVQQISQRLHWVIRLIAEALEGGVEEVVQDAIAQIAQVIEGNRLSWDGNSSLISFVAGGAAEGLAGGMHLGVGRWKPHLEDTAAFHGATEAVADVVVGAGAAGILGGGMNDLWAGAVGGAFSGAVEKKAHDAGDAIDRVVNGGAVKMPVVGAIGEPGGERVPVAGGEGAATAPAVETGVGGGTPVAGRGKSPETGSAGTLAGGGGPARGEVPSGRGSGRGGTVAGDAVPSRNGGGDVPLAGRVVPVRGGVPAVVDALPGVGNGGVPAERGTGDVPQAGSTTGSSPAVGEVQEPGREVPPPATAGSPVPGVGGVDLAVEQHQASESRAPVPGGGENPADRTGTGARADVQPGPVVPSPVSHPAPVVPPAVGPSTVDPQAGPASPQTSPAWQHQSQTEPVTGEQDVPPPAQPRADAGLPGSVASAPHLDGGLPGPGAGLPRAEAGEPGPDAGVPRADAGQPSSGDDVPSAEGGERGPDAGVPRVDAGLPGSDAGVPRVDSGQSSSGAGVPRADAGQPGPAPVEALQGHGPLPGVPSSSQDLPAQSSAAPTPPVTGGQVPELRAQHGFAASPASGQLTPAPSAGHPPATNGPQPVSSAHDVVGGADSGRWTGGAEVPGTEVVAPESVAREADLVAADDLVDSDVDSVFDVMSGKDVDSDTESEPDVEPRDPQPVDAIPHGNDRDVTAAPPPGAKLLEAPKPSPAGTPGRRSERQRTPSSNVPERTPPRESPQGPPPVPQPAPEPAPVADEVRMTGHELPGSLATAVPPINVAAVAPTDLAAASPAAVAPASVNVAAVPPTDAAAAPPTDQDTADTRETHETQPVRRPAPQGVTPPLPAGTQVPRAPGQAPEDVSQVVRAQTPMAPERATDIAHRSVVATLAQPAVDGRRLLIGLHRLTSVPDAQARSYQLAQALSAAHEDGRLSDANYERALQVMGRVTTFPADPGDERPVGSIAVPPDGDPAELPSVQELASEVGARVRRRDFEGAVTLLGGLGRDAEAVRAVEDAYWDEFSRDLATELRRLRPDESAYVDHLLGEVITDPVSREQADAWFAQMRELTFDDHLFGERRVPFDYPDDGCAYRAHRMAVALQQRGADPRKIVIAGAGLGTDEVEWDFHVAVAVAVLTPARLDWVVFDPSVDAERPLSVDDWAHAVGAEEFRRFEGTAESVRHRLTDDQRDFPERWDDGFPVDVPVLVLTEPRVYGFSELTRPHDTSWENADERSRSAIVDMREYYVVAAERRVDRALADVVARVELAAASGAGVSIDLVCGALSTLAEREPVGVDGLFSREPEPLLRLLHLLPGHVDAIEDAVTPGGTHEAGAQPEVERTGVVQRGRVRALPGHEAVERSAFEVRRFATEDGPVTEVTVRVALDPEGRHGEATREALLRSAQAGVDRYFNSGRDGGPLRRPDGEPLWFRLLPADGTSVVHHVVSMDPGRLIDQTNWHPGQSREHSAHEFGHMLGLVDESTVQGGGLDVSGTLMGRWSPDAVPADGLRMPRRFTEVLDLFIGDVPLDDHVTVFPDGHVADLPPHTVVPRAPGSPGTERREEEHPLVVSRRRSRPVGPVVFGDPDWVGVRQAVTDLAGTPGAEWVGTAFSDDRLRELAARPGGELREQVDGTSYWVRVDAYGDAADPVDTYASVVRTYGSRQDIRRAAQEQQRSGAALAFTVPALGPVPVSGSVEVHGLTPKSSTSQLTNHEEDLSSEVVSQRPVRRSGHRVRFLVGVDPKPRRFSLGVRSADLSPQPAPVTVEVPMTLDWPRSVHRRQRAAQQASLSRAIQLPRLNAAVSAKDQAAVLVERRRRLDAMIKLAGFESGLIGPDDEMGGEDPRDVAELVRRHYGLATDHPEVIRMREWLRSFDGRTTRAMLVFGQNVHGVFKLARGGRRDAKVVVNLQQVPGAVLRYKDGTTRITHRRTVSNEHSTTHGKTREHGVTVKVSTGQNLAEVLGVGLGAEVTFLRQAVDSVGDERRFSRQSVHADVGELSRFELSTRLLFWTGEVGRELRVGGVPGAVWLLAAPPGAMDSKPSSLREVTGGDPRPPSGMHPDEALHHVHAQYVLRDDEVAPVVGAIVHALAAQDVVSAENIALVAQDLTAFLQNNLSELVNGGEAHRFTVRPGGRSLFLSLVPESGSGHYVKPLPWRELSDRSSSGRTGTLPSSRRRTHGFRVTADVDTGPVKVGADAGLTRGVERANDIRQTISVEHSWSGAGTSHNFEFSGRLTAWLGDARGERDSTVRFPDLAGVRFEVVAPERPGAGVTPDPSPAPAVDEHWRVVGEVVPKGLRSSALPPDVEVEAMPPERLLAMVVKDMLSLGGGVAGGFRDRAVAAVKWVVRGPVPARLGGQTQDEDDHAVSRDALEDWASRRRRQDNVELTARGADVLHVESANSGSVLMPGSEALVGWAKLGAEYYNPVVVEVDPGHTFTRKAHTEVSVPRAGERTWQAALAARTSVPVAGIVKTNQDVSAAYTRGHRDADAGTVARTQTVTWEERGYLVRFQVKHTLDTSVHAERTGPLGGTHVGPATRRTREKWTANALTAWVPASQLPGVPGLSEHDVETNLEPEDGAAYRAAVSGSAPAVVVTPPQHDRWHQGVHPGLVDHDPMSPRTLAALTDHVGAAFRQWITTKVPASAGEETIGSYRLLFEEMLPKFAVAAQRRDGPRSGLVLFGERAHGNGKLQLLLVVDFEVGDGTPLDRRPGHRSSTEVVTRSEVAAGAVSEVTAGVNLGVGADITVPKLSLPGTAGQLVAEQAGTALSGVVNDLVKPQAAATAHRTGRPVPAATAERSAVFTWEGPAERSSNPLRVTVTIVPWKRDGDYVRHLPGLRNERVQGVHHADSFALPDAVRLSSPTFLADLDVLSSATGSLRELWDREGRSGVPADANLQAWPFTAPELFARLRELAFHDLNARRAAQLLMGSDVDQLAPHLPEMLTPEGHRLDIGGEITSVTFKADLLDRELFARIPGGEVETTTTTSTRALRTVTRGAAVRGSLLSGLAAHFLGEAAVEAKTESERQSETGGAAEVVGTGRRAAHPVRAKLAVTVEVEARDGTRQTWPVFPGEVWFRVDEQGAEVLGLTVPVERNTADAAQAGLRAPLVRELAPDEDDPASPTASLGGDGPAAPARTSLGGDGSAAPARTSLDAGPAHLRPVAGLVLDTAADPAATGTPGLSEVDHTVLVGGDGAVRGVFFPGPGEKTDAVVRRAFLRGAGRPGTFSVVLHRGGPGFSLRRRQDGPEVRVDEAGVTRLLAAVELLHGTGLSRSSDLVLLSCRIADPALGDGLGRIAELLRGNGFRGGVIGADTRVEVRDDGTVRVLDSGTFHRVGPDGVRTTGHVVGRRPDGGGSVQAVRPGLDGASPEPSGSHLVTSRNGPLSEPPVLRVAGDRTLAINGVRSSGRFAEVDHAREFFATTDVLDRAREVLRGLGSGVTLDVSATTLALGGPGREQVLHRVVPLVPPDTVDVSRDFAGVVHGAGFDTVLFTGADGTTTTAPVNAGDGLEITGLLHLADGLAVSAESGEVSDVDGRTAASFVGRGPRPTGGVAGGPLPGRRYAAAPGLTGHAPEPAGRMDDLARRVGVNRYAWARPGQAYVSVTVPGDGSPGHVANGHADSRDLGHHFAVVVAESADGQSQITLENHVRGGELDAAVRDAISRNLDAHGGRLDQLSADLAVRLEQARDDVEAERLHRELALSRALAAIEPTGYDAAGTAARRTAWQAMAAELGGSPGAPRWHFRMYSRRPGESFHEQRPEGELTVVVLGGAQPPSPASVRFDEGTRTASADDLAGVRAVARQVARAALLRAEHGLALPTATITGRGNGRSGPFGLPVPTSAARARAELVRTEFVAAVERELVVLRGEDARASAAAVEVRLVTEVGAPGSGVPAEEMRQATVEIGYDDPRTAQQRTEGEYDRAAHGLTTLRVPRAEVRAVTAEYSALAAGGRLEHLALPPGTRERLVSLDDALAVLDEPAVLDQVRAFVTEALLAASLVPTREVPLRPGLTDRGHVTDRREIRPITSDRLTAVLDDLTQVVSRGANPFTAVRSSLRGIHLRAGTALPVRLATLGLVNLSVGARTAVVASPLFAALRDNPSALTESLFAGAGHEEQHFITTCVAAAVNTALRTRVPGISALLHLGRSAADSVEWLTGRTAAEVRSAADRPFGRSLEEMARGRVAASRSEFDAIERRALDLVAADQGDLDVRREWRSLTARWGRTMQKLAAADLGHEVVPVLTRKVVEGHWWTSALLAAPALVDRGHRRLADVKLPRYAAKFQSSLALEPDATRFGAEPATTSGVPLAANLAAPGQRAEFWSRLASSAGHVVMTPDHAVHLQAGVVDGRRVFVLNDPMRSHPSVLTAAELIDWASDWEAKVSQSLLPWGEPAADSDGSDGSDEESSMTHPGVRRVPVPRAAGGPAGWFFPSSRTPSARSPRALPTGRSLRSGPAAFPAWAAEGPVTNRDRGDRRPSTPMAAGLGVVGQPGLVSDAVSETSVGGLGIGLGIGPGMDFGATGGGPVDVTSARPVVTEHAASSSSAGGVSFVAGAEQEERWERLHRGFTSPWAHKNPFYVFATMRDGRFVVGGELLDGERLAAHVRDTAAFQRYARASQLPGPVRLVAFDPADPRAALHAARRFAEALRGDGPYRRVEAAVHRAAVPVREIEARDLGFTRVSAVRPDDLEWKPLYRANGELFGMGLGDVLPEWDESAPTSRLANDEALRTVVEVADGQRPRPTAARWAAATSGSRTRPAPVLLTRADGGFTGRLSDGATSVHTPEELAPLLAGSSLFAELTDGPVRPTLLLFTHTLTTAAGVERDNALLLRRLRDLAGPFHSFDHAGRIGFYERAMLAVSENARFTETGVPRTSDVVHVARGPVLGFPTRGGGRDPLSETAVLNEFAVAAEHADQGGHPWAPRRPLLVSSDVRDGAYARVDLRSGSALELDGARFFRMLLGDPGFVAALRADPWRPVVLLGRDAGARDNFGGFGFDFAGAMRAHGFFHDVYAAKGAPRVVADGTIAGGAEFVEVSRLRAGDLHTDFLRNRDGRSVAVHVWSGADAAQRERVRAWADAATATALRHVRVRGRFGTRNGRSPWSGGDDLPLFVFVSAADRGGYRAVRRDGVVQHLSDAALGKVLRADREVRAALGRAPGGAGGRHVVLVVLGGASSPSAEFGRSLAEGGIARWVHVSSGTVSLSEDGDLVLGPAGFASFPPPPPGAGDLVTRVMANEVLGEFGQFFPLDELDSYDMATQARIDVPERRGYYFRSMPVRNADGTIAHRQVPHVTPWAATTGPAWELDGHGTPRGFRAARRTDRPLEIGDVVEVSGDVFAGLVAATEVFRRAAPAPSAQVTLLQCQIDGAPSRWGRGPTQAERFRTRWQELRGTGVTVLAAKRTVDVYRHLATRGVQDGGAFGEVGPVDGVPLPEVPLADLATNAIEEVGLRFAPGDRTLLPARKRAVRAAARKVARAAAWRTVKGVPLPKVTITGFGGALPGSVLGLRLGRARAEAVAALFTAELAAESAKLARLGLVVRPEQVEVRITGHASASARSAETTVAVELSRHELGEEALRLVPDAGASEAVVAALDEVFGPLAAHSATSRDHGP
ncbi:protein-glutamine glutaminase family protein [Nocardia sp. NRRL S-836]|uniref:protein-glutamine glutaminase family protein n=1 Tax=Nocardia sp. NRRL S-836 TaxID=1519492 RepID=UPI0006AE86B6|nr:protein-glutamine glutaminase family protein [Nocardia sp. NRRL S-836]KOV83957.1 hypothetical protein ADL03_19040 [Nocardia sp. NRRL S-836]